MIENLVSANWLDCDGLFFFGVKTRSSIVKKADCERAVQIANNKNCCWISSCKWAAAVIVLKNRYTKTQPASQPTNNKTIRNVTINLEKLFQILLWLSTEWRLFHCAHNKKLVQWSRKTLRTKNSATPKIHTRSKMLSRIIIRSNKLKCINYKRYNRLSLLFQIILCSQNARFLILFKAIAKKKQQQQQLNNTILNIINKVCTRINQTVSNLIVRRCWLLFFFVCFCVSVQMIGFEYCNWNSQLNGFIHSHAFSQSLLFVFLFLLIFC